MTRNIELVTLGVYGSTEESFFGTIERAGIDVFVDVRQRRGMRGNIYSYANSIYLQNRLREMGINYFHAKSLSPTSFVRQSQKVEDAKKNVRKRDRDTLGNAFVQAYRTDVLDHYDLTLLIDALPEMAETVALFCVERTPQACHRSLVAAALRDSYGFSVSHLDTGMDG